MDDYEDTDWVENLDAERADVESERLKESEARSLEEYRLGETLSLQEFRERLTKRR